MRHNKASQAERILGALERSGGGFQVYQRAGRWVVRHDDQDLASRGDTLADALAQVAQALMATEDTPIPYVLPMTEVPCDGVTQCGDVSCVGCYGARAVQS